MAVSNVKAVFQCDIKKVWEVVTSLENYAWRSDLSRIEILNENQFIEYTKDGYPTTFRKPLSHGAPFGPCSSGFFLKNLKNLLTLTVRNGLK